MSRDANAPAALQMLRIGAWTSRVFSVAKDAATAKAYATDPDGPYVYYYRSLFTKLKRGGRLELFKTAAISLTTR